MTMIDGNTFEILTLCQLNLKEILKRILKYNETEIQNLLNRDDIK